MIVTYDYNKKEGCFSYVWDSIRGRGVDRLSQHPCDDRNGGVYRMIKKIIWVILGIGVGVVLWWQGILLWGILATALLIMVKAFIKAMRKPKDKIKDDTGREAL